MSAKLHDSPKGWVDPDDAPELTDEWFEKGTWHIDGKVATKEEAQASMVKRGRGRPVGSGTKEHINLRIDVDILEGYRKTGAGWQTRMNEALREWLVTHRA